MADEKKISGLTEASDASASDEFVMVNKDVTSGADASASGQTSKITLGNLRNAILGGSSGSSGNDIIFAENGGNVGIGTDSPTRKLVVKGVDNSEGAYISCITGDVSNPAGPGWGGLLIGDPITEVGGSVQYHPISKMLQIASKDSIQFKIDDRNTMTILDTGNVGIGIADPLARLDILEGTHSEAMGFRVRTNPSGDASDHKTASIGLAQSANTHGTVLDVYHNASSSICQDANLLQIRTNVNAAHLADDTELIDTKFIIKGSGNVGIGTDSPDHPLHVMGNGLPTAIFETPLTATANVASAGVSFRAKNSDVDNVRNEWILSADGGTSRLSIRSHNDTKLVIHDNGKVGIGTSVPNAPLDVEGSGSSNYTIAEFKPNNYQGTRGLAITTDVNADIQLEAIRSSDSTKGYKMTLNPNGGDIVLGGNLVLHDKVKAPTGHDLPMPQFIGDYKLPRGDAGWYELMTYHVRDETGTWVQNQGRGAGKLTLSYTGGDFSPSTFEIEYGKEYTDSVSINSFKWISGTAQYITSVRLVEYEDLEGVNFPTKTKGTFVGVQAYFISNAPSNTDSPGHMFRAYNTPIGYQDTRNMTFNHSLHFDPEDQGGVLRRGPSSAQINPSSSPSDLIISNEMPDPFGWNTSKQRNSLVDLCVKGNAVLGDSVYIGGKDRNSVNNTMKRIICAPMVWAGPNSAGNEIASIDMGSENPSQDDGTIIFKTSVNANDEQNVNGHAYMEERMRVSPYGKIGIGTSSPNSLLHVNKQSTTDGGYIAQFTSTAFTGTNDNGIYIQTSGNTSGGGYSIRCQRDGTDVFYVREGDLGGYFGGALQVTGTVSSSELDADNLDNIRAFEASGLDNINNLVVSEFEKDGVTKRGIVAQDMQKVLPQSVSGGEELEVVGADSEETETRTSPLATSNDELVATLVKAVQELSAELNELKSK